MSKALLVFTIIILASVIIFVACGGGNSSQNVSSNSNLTSGSTGTGTGTGGTPTPTPSSSSMVPLMDMGNNTYLGFSGGLYTNGSNTLPTAHHLAGLGRANAIHPMDTMGN